VKNITILGLFFQRPHWIKHFSNSENLYIILFVLFARVAGFKCRFVASLYPIPLSFSKKKIITNEDFFNFLFFFFKYINIYIYLFIDKCN